MVDFTHRSSEVEIMDTFSGTVSELKTILQDINRVNKLLGGYSITLSAVVEMIRLGCKESYTILDVGCAEGTMLRKLADEARKHNIKVKLIGVDFNEQALQLAQQYSSNYPEISYVNTDILKTDFSNSDIDVVMSTLTLHHFTDDGIIKFVNRFVEIAKLGVVINDLERSPVAYSLFKAFSFFFIKTDIAKKDGLLSIRRAFKEEELKHFASRVTNASHKIKWKWAFRYVWILKKK